MAQNIPVASPDKNAIYIYLPFRNKQDVQNFITYAADVWSRYTKRIVSDVHPSLPVGPHELAKAGRLDLDPGEIDKEILSALKYIQCIRRAQLEGKPLPVNASNVRTRTLCEQSWPSFAHYLSSPNAPKHLRCKGCFKRVPVGADIHELPERRTKPNASSRIDVINTIQLCEAKDCPVYGQPHSIGLFSHSGCGAHRSLDVVSTANAVTDEAFWEGNDMVPNKVLSWARIIAREELVWRQGGRKGVSTLYETHSKASIDKMREDICAFRAYVSTVRSIFSSFLEFLLFLLG